MPLQQPELTWRDAVGYAGALPTAQPEPEGDISHLLPAAPRARPKPAEPRNIGFQSIPRLTAEKSASGDLGRFKGVVRDMPGVDTQTLVLRVGTAMDPLTLWALHVTLTKRGVPPAQRWPACDGTPQMAFITWLADVFWFAKTHPEHAPASKGWQRLLSLAPASPEWHDKAFWLYASINSRNSLAHVTARGAAMTPAQRQELMMVPTASMVAERRELQSDAFAAVRERILSHAHEHPDRAGKHSPEAIANRRAALWRVYVLAGRSPTITAKHWALLTGERLARQVVSKQVAIVADLLR